MTFSFDRPTRSSYRIATSTTRSGSCTARVLITGVRLRPSGRGERRRRADFETLACRWRYRSPPCAQSSSTSAQTERYPGAVSMAYGCRRRSYASQSPDQRFGPLTRQKARKVFWRVGGISIQKADDIVAGRRKPCLQRGTIASVHAMLNQTNRKLSDTFRSVVAGSIINHNQLEIANTHLAECGLTRETPPNRLRDGTRFVENRDTDR